MQMNTFGDDWYAEGGVWECVKKNGNMEAFRQKSED